MLRFAKLVHHPRKLYRMTGLTLDQFQTLTNRLTPLWEQAERMCLSQRKRKPRHRERVPSTSCPRWRTNSCACSASTASTSTFELLGYLVGLDASNICRLKPRLEPLIEQAADPSLGLSLRRRLPPGVKRIGTWEELVERCPDFADVVTDATKQARLRPPRRTQRRWYSGKRKRHTLKTQLSITRQSGRILHISSTVPGRVHDYALLKRTRLDERLPPKTRLTLDRGYDGAMTDYPTPAIALPVKRRGNHQVLTRSERAFNRLQARQRIIVEHVPSCVKKYQLLAQVYRHRIADYNHRFRNIAALTNFRLTPTVT